MLELKRVAALGIVSLLEVPPRESHAEDTKAEMEGRGRMDDSSSDSSPLTNHQWAT